MKKIILTRDHESNLKLISELENLDIEIINFPVIKYIAKEESSETSRCVENLSSYTWIIFTSPRGVKFFNNICSQIPSNVKIALVGKETEKELVKNFSRSADLLPKQSYSKYLADELINLSEPDMKVLIIAGDKSLNIISEKLTASQIENKALLIYKNILNQPEGGAVEQVKSIPEGDKIFIFYSPSAVSNTISILGDLGSSVKVVYGDTTEDCLSSHGYKADFNLQGARLLDFLKSSEIC